MIIRKPTKIELKPEDDFEEYENYKEEQQAQMNKMNRVHDVHGGIDRFGSEFGLGIPGSNRLFGPNFPLSGPNDRSFMGDYPANFQQAFNNDLNLRYIQPSGNNQSISGSQMGNFGQSNLSQFDRSQLGPGGVEGGQLNQLFSALISGPGLGLTRPPHPGASGTSSFPNPNPNSSLNNSN